MFGNCPVAYMSFLSLDFHFCLVPWQLLLLSSGLGRLVYLNAEYKAFEFCQVSSNCACFIVIMQVGVGFLLVILLVVLALAVVHYWASNNFYLTRIQMFFVCFLAFLLALAAFLVGFFEGDRKKLCTCDFS